MVHTLGTCKPSRFDSIQKSRANSQIFKLAVLHIARRNQTTQTINGA